MLKNEVSDSKLLMTGFLHHPVFVFALPSMFVFAPPSMFVLRSESNMQEWTVLVRVKVG